MTIDETHKSPIEKINADDIKTAKELAMYIVGMYSQAHLGEFIATELILDVCYKIIERRSEQ